MSVKLRTLAQALISELGEPEGTKDAESSKTEWWQQFDWKSPDHRTLFDSLGEETQERIIEAGLVKDDLVEEEFQGNAESITESQRAMLFFNIPQDTWDALSEMEKEDYIGRLPPKKTRAGGEELSDRDCVYLWNEIRDKLLQKAPDKDMAKVEPMMLQRIITELVFDGDSVTIKAETMNKLREYGIDLDPCESDNVETDVVDDPVEDEEPMEDSVEQEIEETPSVDLPSTDQIIWETEKVLQDIKRLVG